MIRSSEKETGAAGRHERFVHRVHSHAAGRRTRSATAPRREYLNPAHATPRPDMLDPCLQSGMAECGEVADALAGG